MNRRIACLTLARRQERHALAQPTARPQAYRRPGRHAASDPGLHPPACTPQPARTTLFVEVIEAEPVSDDEAVSEDEALSDALGERELLAVCSRL